MASELAHPSWELPDLEPHELGPYGDFPRLADAEKSVVWDEYLAGRPSRPPVTLIVNNRIFLLDPRFCDGSPSYQEVFEDAQAMLTAQLRTQYVLRRRHHLFCDLPTELPDRWVVAPNFQNVYEAAALGAEIRIRSGEIPSTRPMLSDQSKRSVLDADLGPALERGVARRGIEMTQRMQDLVADRTFFGRPIEVAPYAELGSDGPLTVAMNLRGDAILVDLLEDPDYVHALFDRIVTTSLERRQAFLEHWDLPPPDEVWLADDAIATLGVAQYREHVLPHHRKWYDAIDPERCRRRTMHLCGDATRHFPTIRDELGVASFDTGFPVDFAALQRDLGPDVEILGGVEVPLLLEGSPEEVQRRTREILDTGIGDSGRFILRDANNLPPRVPWPNLAAMYHAALAAR